MPKPLQNTSQSASTGRRRRTLNTWLLAFSAIVLFVIAPAAYLWHNYQTRQLANSFLSRADQLFSEKKPRDAAEYLQRYLQIKPKDSNIRARLAEAYDESASTSAGKRRAIELYYQALGFGENETNADVLKLFKQNEPGLHRRLCELLLETGQYAAAEQEAGKLSALAEARLKADPRDKQAGELQSQGKRLFALAVYKQCQLGTWKKSGTESASEILEQALKDNRGDRELAPILAVMYRDEPQWLSEEKQKLTTEERNQRADQFVDDLISARPTDSGLLLIRYRYRQRYGLPKASEDLSAAFEAAPNDPAVLAAEGEAESAAAQAAFATSGRLEDAKPHLESALGYWRQVIAAKPGDENAVLNASNIQQRLGKPEESLKTCEAGLERLPNSIRLNLEAARILLDQNRSEEAAAAAPSQGKLGYLERAERLIAQFAIQAKQENSPEQLQALGGFQETARLLRGQWHFERGNLQEALSLLKQVPLGEKTANALQAGSWLGEIHTRMMQPDQAAKYFEDVAVVFPRSLDAHQAAANAWEMLGRFDLSEKHRRQAVEIQDTVENRYLLARALFRAEMQKPAADRQWGAFDKAMSLTLEAKAESDSVFSWQPELLAIEVGALREKGSDGSVANHEQTLERLRALENSHPSTPALLVELILDYESLQAPGDADRAAAELARLKPEAAATYLAQSRLAIQRRNAGGARAALAEGMQKVGPDDKSRLQRELVAIDLAENRDSDAAKHLGELLQSKASLDAKSLDFETLNLVLTFVEKAVNNHDIESAKRWEGKLLESEGPDGSLWRYARGMRLLAAAKDVKDPEFAEAEKLLAELAKIRPSWSLGCWLGGVILERQGKLEEAVEAFQNAIRLGCRQVAVHERLAALLTQLGRYAEADRCLAGLPGRIPSSLSQSSFEIARAAERGEWQNAIALARRAAEADAGNPQAAFTLSRLLEADNQVDAADDVLQRAAQTNSKDPGVHYQILAFYVRNGKTELAKEYLRGLSENVAIPQADRTRVLAQGHELIGDAVKAKETWKTLAGEVKDTAVEQTALGEQLMNRDPEGAEKALRRALQIDKNYGAARVMLAGLLANRGGEAEWKEALSLLSDSLADARQERLRQTVLALVYASRGGKANLEKARNIVERLLSDPRRPSIQESLLLAKIYEAEGNVEEARARLKMLVEASPNPRANDVAAYVDLLLRQELPQGEEARQELVGERERWVKELQTLAPDSPQSITLTARWLETCNRGAEIEPLVETWATAQRAHVPKNPKEEIKFSEMVGNLYMSLEAYPAAERWYRQAMAKAADHYAPLARCLACQGRYEEAFHLCESAAENDSSPRSAIIAASLLFEGQPAAEDLARAEKLLGKAAETYGDQPNVLNVWAAVMILQGRMDDAATLYRRVLKLQPRDALAMNNLATVLADQPDKGTRDEGKELIEKAITLSGPRAGFLDVKGTILLAEKDAEQAIPLLEEAATSSQADSRYVFHLAVAYLRAGKVDQAREAFQRARKLGLDRQILTPGDKRYKTELEQALNSQSNAKP
jgi:tetratricopeptide (TPR) repeat protein